MRKWIQESPVMVGVGLIALGLVMIFFAWNGAAGLDFVSGQVPYLISGGLTGVALIASGLTVVVVQAHRKDAATLAQKLDEVAEAVRALGTATVAGPTAVPEGDMVIAGRATYHLPTCRLVKDRSDLQPMSPEAAGERGLTPCRICKPTPAAESA